MKKLNLFTNFDWGKFSKDKHFTCIGCQPWKDYDSGELLGTKVETVITYDHTDYGEANVSNLYEKVSFKISKEINIPININVAPKGVVATVYGDFRNQLSCTAEDIAVISRDKN